MAKDAGGHGSEARGGGSGSSGERGMRAGRGVTGVQARNNRMFAMFDRAKAQGHTGLYGSDAAAAAKLAGGHPKSAPVATHPGAAGRSDADLEKDYGGPVRHFGPDSTGRSVTVSEYSKGKTTYPKVK